jgi:3-methylcrotonyl-CoA carboxylase beta subunit
MWMWPNARISVMGGDQAAAVMSTIQRDNAEKQGKVFTAEEQAALEAPIKAKYEKEGSCYFSTARLWDGMCLSKLVALCE